MALVTSAYTNLRQGYQGLLLVPSSGYLCGCHLLFGLKEESMCNVTYSLCVKFVHRTSSVENHLCKHLSRTKTKQHKPMCGFFSASINWSSLRDSQEKTYKVCCSVYYPQTVWDFMPRFTVSQKLLLRKMLWTAGIKEKIKKFNPTGILIYGLSHLPWNRNNTQVLRIWSHLIQISHPFGIGNISGILK